MDYCEKRARIRELWPTRGQRIYDNLRDRLGTAVYADTGKPVSEFAIKRMALEILYGVILGAI